MAITKSFTVFGLCDVRTVLALINPWFVAHGMTLRAYSCKPPYDKVRQSLQKLADEEGVVTRLNSAVAQIITEPIEAGSSTVKGSKASQKVTGVRLADGEVMTADVVVRILSTLNTPETPHNTPDHPLTPY